MGRPFMHVLMTGHSQWEGLLEDSLGAVFHLFLQLPNGFFTHLFSLLEAVKLAEEGDIPSEHQYPFTHSACRCSCNLRHLQGTGPGL